MGKPSLHSQSRHRAQLRAAAHQMELRRPRLLPRLPLRLIWLVMALTTPAMMAPATAP
jgi:hypothetical protein